MRKGQVSIFLIVAVLLVLISGIGYFIYGRIAQARSAESLSTPLWAIPVRAYVDECLRQTAVEGAYLLAAQGGYTSNPEPALITENAIIGYHVYEGAMLAPSRDRVSAELADYVTKALPSCTREFSTVVEQGFSIMQGSIETDVEIGDERINVFARFPLTIAKGDASVVLDRFIIEIPVRLGKLLDVASVAASRVLSDPERITLDRLGSDGFAVNILPYDENTLVYAISDSKSDIEQHPFVFFFASRLTVNEPPRFLFIPNFVLKLGKPFSYEVEVEDDDPIRFSDESPVFNIDPLSGEIKFTPQALGNFGARIYAADRTSKSAHTILFEVIP